MLQYLLWFFNNIIYIYVFGVNAIHFTVLLLLLVEIRSTLIYSLFWTLLWTLLNCIGVEFLEDFVNFSVTCLSSTNWYREFIWCILKSLETIKTFLIGTLLFIIVELNFLLWQHCLTPFIHQVRWCRGQFSNSTSVGFVLSWCIVIFIRCFSDCSFLEMRILICLLSCSSTNI